MKATRTLSQLLWGTGLFCLPFTVFLLLWQGQEITLAHFNPYTSFSLYLSEVLIVAAYVFSRPMAWKTRTEQSVHGKMIRAIQWIVIGLTLLAMSFAIDLRSALGAFIHLTIALMTFQLIHENLLPLQTIQHIVLLSLSLQGVLALLQFLFQHSLGLSLLGEPLLSNVLPGVAKLKWGSMVLLRAYGTFPHANLLAGYSVIGLLLLKSVPRPYRALLGGVIAWALVLSFSKTALLALLVAAWVGGKIPKQWMLPFIIAGLLILRVKVSTWIQTETFTERLDYMKISGKMILEQPQGVGLGQFTAHMQAFTNNKLEPWQFQPVHNVYLLMANEWGIWALGLLLWGIKKFWKKLSDNPQKGMLLAALLTLGLFDHYLLSLPQGMMLTTLVLGIVTHQETYQTPAPKMDPKKSG